MNTPKLVGELVVLAVLLGWTLLWSAIVWLNYTLGDVVGAAITLVLFALVGAVALVWRLNTVRTQLSEA
jgi:hypothetical protein